MAQPFLTVNKSCDKASRWVASQLSAAKLGSLRTFDLKEARHAHPDCSCPVHGAKPCNCCMVVLLVFDGRHPPASLVLEGLGRRTSLYLVNTPQQRAHPLLENAILAALSPLPQPAIP